MRRHPCLFQIVCGASKETDEFLEVFLNYCDVVRTAAEPAAVYHAPISSAAFLHFDHCNMSCFLKA